MHHSCEYIQHCTMIVLTIVRPDVPISVANGCIWISNMFKSQVRHNMTKYLHTTGATHRKTNASACMKWQFSDRKGLVRQLWKPHYDHVIRVLAKQICVKYCKLWYQHKIVTPYGQFFILINLRYSAKLNCDLIGWKFKMATIVI